MAAAAPASSPPRPRTALPRSASTSRARTGRATSPGRCRCWRSRTAGSSSSRSSSMSRPSSRASACLSSTPASSRLEEVLDDLGVAGHPLAEDEELEPVRAGFEAPRHLRPDANRVQPLDIDLVVVQTNHSGTGKDDVHLHSPLVPVAESVMLAGLDDLVRDAERVETEIGSCEARLLELREAALH